MLPPDDDADAPSDDELRKDLETMVRVTKETSDAADAFRQMSAQTKQLSDALRALKAAGSLSVLDAREQLGVPRLPPGGIVASGYLSASQYQFKPVVLPRVSPPLPEDPEEQIAASPSWSEERFANLDLDEPELLLTTVDLSLKLDPVQPALDIEKYEKPKQPITDPYADDLREGDSKFTLNFKPGTAPAPNQYELARASAQTAAKRIAEQARLAAFRKVGVPQRVERERRRLAPDQTQAVLFVPEQLDELIVEDRSWRCTFHDSRFEALRRCWENAEPIRFKIQARDRFIVGDARLTSIVQSYVGFCEFKAAGIGALTWL